MISLKNVNKSYDGTKLAVDNLNLVVNDGEIFGFLGSNGAGKTTTIKMMTGITGVDSGSIAIDGHDISTQSIETKRLMGYVSDDPDQFLRLTGYEYLSFMSDIYRVPADIREKRIMDLADRFMIKDVLQNPIQNYSHGMRQKIMIMGALIHDPEVWILDEPLTGLDPQSAYSLKEMMREHSSNGKTVFYVIVLVLLLIRLKMRCTRKFAELM